MSDFIKKSIIDVSRLHFGASHLEDLSLQNVEGLSNLEEFISNRSVLVLYVFLEHDKILRFLKRISDGAYAKIIVFSKNKPLGAESGDFLKRLQINTVSGSPTLDLYEFINKIFYPNLRKDYDIALKRKVTTLQSALKSTILIENSQLVTEPGSPDLSLLECYYYF